MRHPVEAAQRLGQTFGGLRISRPRRQTGSEPDRRAKRDLALHPVQNRHHRGARQHGIGHPDRVGIDVRQMLDQPDHVIAEIAEQPRRCCRHIVRHLDPGFRDQRPQAFQRRAFVIGESVGIARLAVDPGATGAAFPDQVGLHADDGIAPAHLSAGDAFQHEAVRRRLGQLQHQADRGVQIRRKAQRQKLVAARCPTGGEGLEIRGDLHGHIRDSTAAMAA